MKEIKIMNWLIEMGFLSQSINHPVLYDYPLLKPEDIVPIDLSNWKPMSKSFPLTFIYNEDKVDLELTKTNQKSYHARGRA